jgi:hypothetical protein
VTTTAPAGTTPRYCRPCHAHCLLACDSAAGGPRLFDREPHAAGTHALVDGAAVRLTGDDLLHARACREPLFRFHACTQRTT